MCKKFVFFRKMPNFGKSLPTILNALIRSNKHKWINAVQKYFWKHYYRKVNCRKIDQQKNTLNIQIKAQKEEI